jgi:hypothetical protein
MKLSPCTRRASRVIAGAALSSLAVAVAGTWATAPVQTTQQHSAYDYCVILYPVYVDDTMVFAGGSYCVPVPGPQPSQPT